MSPETDLLTRLDHELGDLPAVPGTTYLLEGRQARRRRRRHRTHWRERLGEEVGIR